MSRNQFYGGPQWDVWQQCWDDSSTLQYTLFLLLLHCSMPSADSTAHWNVESMSLLNLFPYNGTVLSGGDGKQQHPKCVVHGCLSCSSVLIPLTLEKSWFRKAGCWRWKQAVECVCENHKRPCLALNPRDVEIWRCLKPTFKATITCIFTNRSWS